MYIQNYSNYEDFFRQHVQWVKDEWNPENWFENSFEQPQGGYSIFGEINFDENAKELKQAIEKVCEENGKLLNRADWKTILNSEKGFFACGNRDDLLMSFIDMFGFDSEYVKKYLDDMFLNELTYELRMTNDAGGSIFEEKIKETIEEYVEDYSIRYKKYALKYGFDYRAELDRALRIKIGHFDMLPQHDKEMRMKLFKEVNRVRKMIGLEKIKV